MILKLRNGVIEITHNNITEEAKHVYVTYDYEFGTNHLTPLLIVNKKSRYNGDGVEVNLDVATPEVTLDVYLCDKFNNIIKKYTSSYICYKMCTLGTKEYVDIYAELDKLRKENQQLKEKGEVI